MNLESDILDNAVIYFLFFYLFLFALIKLINYKKNVVNFMQMQTNEPYPDPAIEMDLKRVLYFFPLDLICVLSYKKSFICTIIFEKLFASLVDQRQVGFCRQSSPSGVTVVRAKSTSSIITDFDPNLSLMCLNVSLITKSSVFIFFIFKEKV